MSRIHLNLCDLCYEELETTREIKNGICDCCLTKEEEAQDDSYWNEFDVIDDDYEDIH